jgi:hypothetical protein
MGALDESEGLVGELLGIGVAGGPTGEGEGPPIVIGAVPALGARLGAASVLEKPEGPGELL